MNATLNIPGKRIRLTKWIHGGPYALRVEVDAVIPDADPSEPCLEPQTVRQLDELQRLANEGKADELAKHGILYVRQSA